jgi:hypothetical protein
MAGLLQPLKAIGARNVFCKRLCVWDQLELKNINQVQRATVMSEVNVGLLRELNRQPCDKVRR